MIVTLVIPTYNRAALLRTALQSVLASRIPDGLHVECIVVDNNSRDDTRDTVAHLQSHCGPISLQYHFEPCQGVSHARNRGLACATARYVAFMDDEQQIDRDYLARLPAAFEKTRAACVGGRIRYLATEDVPSWLVPVIATIGQLDLGSEAKLLGTADGYLKGGNIAFDMHALSRIGPFNTLLGRNGDEMFAAEEDEIQDRLRVAGFSIVYTPELIQYNTLLPEKHSRRFWRHWAVGRGRTAVRRTPAPYCSGRRVCGYPAFLVRALLGSTINYIQHAVMNGFDQAFAHELDLIAIAGMLAEARTLPRDTG